MIKELFKLVEGGLSIVGLAYIALKALQWKGVDVESLIVKGLEYALTYLAILETFTFVF